MATEKKGKKKLTKQEREYQALERSFYYYQRKYLKDIDVQTKKDLDENRYMRVGGGNVDLTRVVVGTYSAKSTMEHGVVRRKLNEKKGKMVLTRITGPEALKEQIESYKFFVDKTQQKQHYIDNVERAMSRSGYTGSQINNIKKELDTMEPEKLADMIRYSGEFDFPDIYEGQYSDRSNRVSELLNAIDRHR